MSRFIILVTLVATALCWSMAIDAQVLSEGFVVKSIGSNEERELRFVRIINGTPESPDGQLLCNKGKYGDIQGVISMDGRWVAFSREIKHVSGIYGASGDYHNFGNYNIYIVRIDGKLPNNDTILIEHGYWPSWGDDSDGPAKTLYYSYTELENARLVAHDQIIHKVTVFNDGSFSTPVEHARCPKQVKDSHMQAAPNGRYIAYRPNDTIRIYDIKEQREIEGAGGAGCHPCWGPFSKVLLWAQTNVCMIEDGREVMKRDGNPGGAGLGYYHFGTSNDMQWVITKSENTPQNYAGKIEFMSVSTTGNEWKTGTDKTEVGTGTWCDIHVGSVEPPVKTTFHPLPEPNSCIGFDSQVSTAISDFEIRISVKNTKHYLAELFDLQGKSCAFRRSAGASFIRIPLNGISGGHYLLRVTTGMVSTQKALWISK